MAATYVKTGGAYVSVANVYAKQSGSYRTDGKYLYKKISGAYTLIWKRVPSFGNVTLDAYAASLKHAWYLDSASSFPDEIGTCDLSGSGSISSVTGVAETGVYLNATAKLYNSNPGFAVNSPFTLSFWAERIGAASNYGTGFMVSKDDGTNQWGIQWSDADQVSIQNFNNTASPAVSVSAGWHNFVVTGDWVGDDGVLHRLFVDGTLVALLQVGQHPDTTNTDFVVGGRTETASLWFNGNVDEIYYWDAMLHSSAITALQTSGLS